MTTTETPTLEERLDRLEVGCDELKELLDELKAEVAAYIARRDAAKAAGR